MEETIIYNQWIDCTDDNYWQTEHDIIAYVCGDETYMMSRHECLLGWNVLCRNNAKFITLSNPFDKETN